MRRCETLCFAPHCLITIRTCFNSTVPSLITQSYYSMSTLSKAPMLVRRRPILCNVRHWGRTDSLSSKVVLARLSKCLPRRRESMVMQRSTLSLLTSLLARSLKNCVHLPTTWMFQMCLARNIRWLESILHHDGAGHWQLLSDRRFRGWLPFSDGR